MTKFGCSRYIKTKENQKLKAKFFRSFWVLYPVGKQAYKLELPEMWKIYIVFYMSLLEQTINRKKQVDENVAELKLNGGESEKYKVEAIWDSAVYIKESKD